MLVKVGGFVFAIDFVVLDMEEEDKIPIILGRPFLLTTRASIDLELGELQIKFTHDKLIVKVYEDL